MRDTKITIALNKQHYRYCCGRIKGEGVEKGIAPQSRYEFILGRN